MRHEFTRKTKAARALHAKGLCEYCGLKPKGRPEYDHFREANDGGGNSFENCRHVCRECHAVKTAGYVKETRKSERIRDRMNGSLTRNGRGFPKREKRRPSTTRPEKLTGLPRNAWGIE